MRGCLHDTGATFVPEWVHTCSLSWLYICFHDTPTKVTPAWVHPVCCAGVRISLRYEVSQLYHVNTKWPHASVWKRSASRLERIAHAKCLRFWILRVFYHHEVYIQITRYEMTSHNVNTIRNKKVIPVWNSRRCEFSHVNTPFWPNSSMEQLCNAGLVL